VRRLYLLIAVLTGLALVIPVSATASQTPLTKSGLGAKTPVGQPSTTLFSTKVATLGATAKFVSGYGGQINSATGGVAVLYVVRGHEAGLLAAVRGHADAADAGYRVVYVPHSWALLEALTTKIARQVPRWRARGIELAKWGPDPATSKVVIWLRAYSPAAARQLLSAYGAGLASVSHTPMTQLAESASNKYYDTPPFFGGDRIFAHPSSGGTVECTDGFVMLGNANPGNHWELTAGHCGRQTWLTNWTTQYTLGSTSTDYLAGAGGGTAIDVQTIGANAWGEVWGDTGTYDPFTIFVPPAGQYLCFDGADPKPDSPSGLECGVQVTEQGPFCIITTDGLTHCQLGEAYDQNREVCLGGDSGGPVFQRQSSGNRVEAVGIITADGPGGHTCYYTLITAIMSTTNTHLDTNPSG
jgi:hypothetical protein